MECLAIPFVLQRQATLKAEAFDILQNLSSTMYEVGGQGKTEKWNNTLPSYAMVHLMYKFSKAPKNKK